MFKWPVKTRDEFLAILTQVLSHGEADTFEIQKKLGLSSGTDRVYGLTILNHALSSCVDSKNNTLKRYKKENTTSQVGSYLYFFDNPTAAPSIPVVERNTQDELDVVIASISKVQGNLLHIKQELTRAEEEIQALVAAREKIDEAISSAQARKAAALDRYSSFKDALNGIQTISPVTTVSIEPVDQGYVKRVPVPPKVVIADDATVLVEKNGQWLWRQWGHAIARALIVLDPKKFSNAYAIVGRHLNVAAKHTKVSSWSAEDVQAFGIPAMLKVEEIFINARRDYSPTRFYQEERMPILGAVWRPNAS